LLKAPCESDHPEMNLVAKGQVHSFFNASAKRTQACEKAPPDHSNDTACKISRVPLQLGPECQTSIPDQVGLVQANMCFSCLLLCASACIAKGRPMNTQQDVFLRRLGQTSTAGLPRLNLFRAPYIQYVQAAHLSYLQSTS